jgi:hypothetical protein
LTPLYSKPTSSTPQSKIINDQILAIAISSCLGLTSSVGLGIGGPNGGVRRVECVRFRVGGDGYESPIDEDDEDAEGMGGEGTVRESFDVYFGVSFGNLTGEWSVKGLDPATSASELEGGKGANRSEESERSEVPPNTVAGWKSKFLEAQRKLWESQEGHTTLRERILEAVL